MKRLRALMVLILATSACLLAMPSVALPVMDLRSEQLMTQSNDLKKALNLNPNQQILWQQVETKNTAIMHERKIRREHLQANTVRDLSNAQVELRDLSVKIDAESDISLAEDKKMREMWLTINDALDENQRQIVVNFLADQLQRVLDTGGDRKIGKKKDGDDSGDSRGRGTGKRKSGGGMGGF